MSALIFSIVVIAVAIFAIKTSANTHTPKKEEKQDFFYVEGHPAHEIKNERGQTVGFASGSGHYITAYDAFLCQADGLNKPCPKELLKPSTSKISFIFKENKTKDFPVLLDYVKEEQTFLQREKEYEVSYSFDEYIKIKFVFDIVKKWKNSNILINEQNADRAVLSKLLQCLEHKAKSTDKKWCLDFSYSSDNQPQCLGCRRLGISAICFDDFLEKRENLFRIKKEEILKIIEEKAKTLKFCPFWNSKLIWESFLKITPACSFNDKKFVCIEDEYGYRVEARHDLYEPLSAIKEYTQGKILSKK